MRLLVWIAGVTVVLVGLSLSYHVERAMAWVFWLLLAFYVVAGLVVLLLGVVRAATSASKVSKP